MFDFAWINELCEKYYASERGIFSAILLVLKRHYPHKNIHFFDIDRQLVCFIKDGNFKFFKPSKKDFELIKKELIVYLSKRKNALLKTKPQMIKKAFLEHFGSEYVRASIIEIKDEHIVFSLTKEGKQVGNLRLIVPIYAFFDTDKVGIGHNFLLKIESVNVEKKFFILGCIRKHNGVIKKEIEEIIALIQRRVLENKSGQKAFVKADFAYSFQGINIENKEVRIEIKNTHISTLMVSVARIIRHRIGFNLKWRVKNETKQH